MSPFEEGFSEHNRTETTILFLIVRKCRPGKTSKLLFAIHSNISTVMRSVSGINLLFLDEQAIVDRNISDVPSGERTSSVNEKMCSLASAQSLSK